jgi:Protein of unknown function (DUF2752)
MTDDDFPRTEEEYLSDLHRHRRLRWWVRGGLLAMVFVPVTVFAVAWIVDPYQGGRVWLEETHTQLGMPECSFRSMTGQPCPSCGMTSSFALFVRGDLLHSLQANAAGTLLAMMSLLFILWGLTTAVMGRMVWLRSWERVVAWMFLVFVGVMLVRWGIVMVLRMGS